MRNTAKQTSRDPDILFKPGRNFPCRLPVFGAGAMHHVMQKYRVSSRYMIQIPSLRNRR
jgi:hypothetical protein